MHKESESKVINLDEKKALNNIIKSISNEDLEVSKQYMAALNSLTSRIDNKKK